jgi:hypothetical protein
LALKAHKVFKVTTEKLVRKDLLVFKVPLAQQARKVQPV